MRWLSGRVSGTYQLVVAGLDPAIHLLRKILMKMMDTRVKPAYDNRAGR
jgi:hypothetical protein